MYLRRLVRHLAAEEALDDVEGHVHPGGDAGRADDAVVDHPEVRSTMTPAPSESRRSSEAQCVVARRPSRRPALASRRAPVQTEVTWRAAVAVRRIQSEGLLVVEEGAGAEPAGHHQEVDRGGVGEAVAGDDDEAAGRGDGSRVRRS